MTWASRLARRQARVTAKLVEMGGRCSIWRREAGEEGQPARGEHERIYDNVPCFITATNEQQLLEPKPHMATYAEQGEAGTRQPRLIEIPVEWADEALEIKKADIVLGPGGFQYYVNDAATDETVPLSIVLNTHILEMTYELEP